MMIRTILAILAGLLLCVTVMTITGCNGDDTVEAERREPVPEDQKRPAPGPGGPPAAAGSEDAGQPAPEPEEEEE